MNTRPIVLHLVDDATAGGVMRVVDFIRTSTDMAKLGEHKVVHIKRGKIPRRRFDADIIVSHLAISWRNLPALLAIRAGCTAKPFIHVEHSYTEGFVALNVRNKRRFSTLLKVAFSIFDRVIAVSEAQAAWIISRGFCTAPKLATVQSCVDLAPFREIPSLAGPVRIFGAIGRLDAQKGFDTLIHAFRTCTAPDIQLHIYGEGDAESLLRQLAGGDERIKFKGFASDPVAAFAQVDAVVMPSRWEAYGLVAIETLSAGRHLICADIDGLNDHKSGGANLFRPGSVNDLAEKIIKLCSEGSCGTGFSPYRSVSVLEERFLGNWADILDRAGRMRAQARQE